MFEESNTSPISSKRNTGTVKKHRNHKHQKQQSLPPKTTDKPNSIDKSRSTPRTNLSNKCTRIEKPTETENLYINHKNKIKKTPDSSVIIK